MTRKMKTKRKHRMYQAEIVHKEGLLTVTKRKEQGFSGHIYRVMNRAKLMHICRNLNEAKAYCEGSKTYSFLPYHMLQNLAHASFVSGKSTDKLVKLFISWGLSRLKKDNYKIL